MAVSPKYVVSTRQVGKRTVVVISEPRTKRVVWQHSYSSIDGTYPVTDEFFWSKDHRAVAFGVDAELWGRSTETKQRYCRVAIWREGMQAKTIYYRLMATQDYTEDMTWSPDDKYLIIRRGGSGMGDDDMGEIACLDIRSHRTYYSGTVIGRPQWTNASTLKFWAPDWDKGWENGRQKMDKPSFWKVPHAWNRRSPIGMRKNAWD